VDDTLDMARETYRVLTSFLDRNPPYRRHPSASWSSLEPTVRAFASAATRDAKGEWAIRHVPEAKNTRISGAVVAGSRLRMRALSPPLSNVREAQPTPEDQAALLRAASEFLRQWLVQRDIDAAMKYVDLAELSAQFDGDARLATRAAVQDWCGRFLTIQLIDDHGAVNRAGHGDPGHPRYAELPTRPRAEGEFRATRKAESPSVSGRDLLFTNMLGAPAFALVLRNEDAVRDAMTLVWRKSEGRWSIVRMLAVAD
jgi:hypothetical protein